MAQFKRPQYQVPVKSGLRFSMKALRPSMKSRLVKQVMEHPDSPIHWSAAEIARRIARREVSSQEVTQAFISRIEAVNPQINAVVIPRFEQAPVIDGKLDEEVWKHAVALKNFYQTNPGDNIAPSKPTEAFLGYDSKTLYLGFHAYDDPDKVRASVAARDNVFGEDNIRVYLDTFNDGRKAYLLGWNPLGRTKAGGLMRESSRVSTTRRQCMRCQLQSSKS